MTCSNGSFNPHPLANPFNTRLGPSNTSLNPASPSYGHLKFSRNPNATLPSGRTVMTRSEAPQSAPIPNLLVTRNGNMLSITSGMGSSEWNDREIMSLDSPEVGLSREDIAYANWVSEMDRKLKKSMTPEQKRILADVEAGKYVAKPKKIVFGN